MESNCSVVNGPCVRGECAWWSTARQECMHPTHRPEIENGATLSNEKTVNKKTVASELQFNIRIGRSNMFWAAIGCGAVMLLSLAFPWTHEETYFGGGGSHGLGEWGILICLVFAGVSIGFAFVSNPKTRGIAHAVGGVLSVILVGLAVYAVGYANRSTGATYSFGFGLILFGLAAIGIIIIGIMELRRTAIRLPVHTGAQETTLSELVERGNTSPKSRLVTALLALFLGMFGVHRFYTGKSWATAMLILGVLGVFGYLILRRLVNIPTFIYWILFLSLIAVAIWVLVDLIFILIGYYTDRGGKRVLNWELGMGSSEVRGEEVAAMPSLFGPETDTTTELPKQRAQRVAAPEDLPQHLTPRVVGVGEGEKRLKEAIAQIREIRNYLAALEKIRADQSISDEIYHTMAAEYKERVSHIQVQIVKMKSQLDGQLELRRNDITAYKKELEKVIVRHKLGELPDNEYLEKYNDLKSKMTRAIQEVETTSALLESAEVEAYADKPMLSYEQEQPEVSLPLPAPSPEAPQLYISMPRAAWNFGTLLRRLGLLICVVGTIVAVLFPPCKAAGVSVGYHFLFQSAGYGLRAYNLINVSSFIIELVAINIVGLALIFFGFRLRSKRTEQL